MLKEKAEGNREFITNERGHLENAVQCCGELESSDCMRIDLR